MLTAPHATKLWVSSWVDPILRYRARYKPTYDASQGQYYKKHFSYVKAKMFRWHSLKVPYFSNTLYIQPVFVCVIITAI